MREQEPQFRIVGGASETAQSAVRRELRNLLREKGLGFLTPEQQRTLKALEYPKSPEELALIDLADRRVSDLMASVDISPYRFPAENIHIVPPELYKELDLDGDSSAITFPRFQTIAFNAGLYRGKGLYFGSVVFHELMHMKGHLALEVQEKGRGKKKSRPVTTFRSGLVAGGEQKRRTTIIWSV